MNGERVGRLRRSPTGELRFEYEADWLGSPRATPISTSMPLSSDPYMGAVVESYLDNLLPDDESIRRRMQVTLDAASSRAFDLLAQAGADCVGAIQLLPSRDVPDVRRIEATPVSDAEVAELLRTYEAHPLGMSPEQDDFRISVAGAQEKTGLLWHEGIWHRPRGPTPTTHLVKLPIGEMRAHGIDLSDSVENEWLCLRLARRLGVPAPQADIHWFHDVKALVVERFDRRWSSDGSWVIRLPQEDACQALGVPPARKYERDGGPGIVDLMDLLLQAAYPQADRTRLFRTLVLYWLLAAVDGHAKNFSFFIQPGGILELTPAYDVLSAYPLVARRQLPEQKLRMAMAVFGNNRHYRWREITRRHWLTTAARCRYPEREAEGVLDDLVESLEPALRDVREDLPTDFPAHVAEPILTRLASAGELLVP